MITAAKSADGQLAGYCLAARDMTQRRGHEKALRRSEERLRLLIEGVSEYAMFVFDSNGNFAT